ncbi:hypothetical protein [Pseudohaliea sp.]|uniref:hypothetical protein n=1 Tax=Pseudohaliea sp. TaxID=2740289 RepID=UPI0032F09C3C
MVDQDAPGLEAHFIRMKEAVAGQLTRFSLVGAVVDNLHQKQWEARRNAALAALGEAALKACLKDGDLKARLLPRVAAGDRARVRALFAGELDSPATAPAQTAGDAAAPAPQSRPTAEPAPAPPEAADPATWAEGDFRRYLREHEPRNRTELRKLNGSVYRQLYKHHPALLEELLPSQRSGAGTRRA